MNSLLSSLCIVLYIILIYFWNILTPFGVLALVLPVFLLYDDGLQQQSKVSKNNDGGIKFRNKQVLSRFPDKNNDRVTPRNFRENFRQIATPETRLDIETVDNSSVPTSSHVGKPQAVSREGSRPKSKRSRSKVKHRTPSFGSTHEHKEGQGRPGTKSDYLDINSDIASDEIQTSLPHIENVTSVIRSTEASGVDGQPKEVTNCRSEEKRHTNLNVSSSVKGKANDGDVINAAQVTVSSYVESKTNDAEGVVNASGVTESEMAMANISRLIQEGQDALQAGRKTDAKRKALQAIVGINTEKDKLLSRQKTSVNEQDLGDWYGGCSFILNSIGENITATQCFYTAVVFDPSWNVMKHKSVADVLWNSLVFSRNVDELASSYPKVLQLLTEIDELAKLAEIRGKWNVCVAADGDINKVFSYLMRKEILEDELIKQPGRKASLWRSARCFLRMGMHDDARKLCSTILQHACDYDDAEAFEIWAYSLFYTGDFDIAKEKCNSALLHCKNHLHKQRLEAFRSKIENEMAASSSVQRSESLQNKSKESTESKKQRHEKRKSNVNKQGKGAAEKGTTVRKESAGINGNLSSACSSPGKQTPRKHNARQKTPDALQTVARKLNYEVIYQRKRNLSVCSTSTNESNRSEIGSETPVNGSEQESISDEESYECSREETPEITVLPVIDPEEEARKEEMSFYEQSRRFYLQNDDKSEYLGKDDTDENLLKYGIKLNSSYMHNFEDRHPDILKRDQFYTDFLDKDKLKEKLLQNPKKYIRCVIQIEGSHEAYCTPVDSKDSMNLIEISGRSKVGQVFNEDEVVVEILEDKDEKGKRFGKVIGIWNRQRHKNTKHPVFICTLDDMESNLVRPMCKTIPKLHVIDREIFQKYKTVSARRYKIETYDYDESAGILCNPKIINLNPAEQRSYIFLVAFISWSPRHIYPRGAIIKILPPGLAESSGLMILNLQHEVPTLYRKSTVDQVASLSKRIGDEPAAALLRGRTNLTGLKTFTIDPQDSKDLDDALSIEQIDGGYRVGVHISDVATFIPKDSPLDDESRQRATTFYPGIRRPRNMLPEPFSTNVCSLLPGKTRLTVSVFFSLTSKGRPMQMEGSTFGIFKSYIRSCRQMTYEEAQSVISSPKVDDLDELTKSVKTLHKIAKEVRKNRLGNAMFAMDLDWEESEQGGSDSLTHEAHYLVEEFMIMANKKVAEWLRRLRFKGYSHCIPLRCQPPPSKEHMEEFLQKNNCYIDIVLRLQDKQVGPRRPSFHECLNSENQNNAKPVMVAKDVWREMKTSPNTAAEYVRKDDMHPLQLTVYQHWLSIQEKAGYRCSGSIKGEEDGKHNSLEMFPYTHFTSPIRRFNDLIVQRLVHSALENGECPYQKQDIESICVHMNSVSKRAKEYEKGCKALQAALQFKTNPKMMNCYVDDVSDKGVALCSPCLKFVPRTQREITFNLLDMGFKPEVIEDPDTKWNKVIAVWRKRLYDFVEKPKYKPLKSNEYKLNPHTGVVFLPVHQWARILRATTDEHDNDLSRAIANASVTLHREGYEDVSTECENPLKIQPNTKFSMTFSRGQQLKIQMSASPNKGIITPKPVLYCMTKNIQFCLQHTENPVLTLYRYETRSTCDQYPHLQLYLERWLPIILMEAATGIVRNEESCCINNVTVKFLNDRKGKFSLGLTDCEIRNIEWSGTTTEDSDDVRSDDTTGSYDWLCLKATLQNPNRRNTKGTTEDFQNLNAVWVGHAEVVKVLKKKQQQSSDGKIDVTFRLHDKTPDLPANFKPDTKFSVEILKKSEVDRRTESFIKELPSQQDSLAAKIAMNKRIPDFDRSRAHIASLRHNQDLVFEINQDDPSKRRTVLPPNNGKQQEAINKALTSRFTLIQGPPGTGKTYTGIKLMYLFDRINYQLSREGQQRKQVLFCGPSNKSVDLVAKWMLNRMAHYTPNFIRVYGRSIEAIDFPIPGRTFLSKRSTRGSHTDPALKSVSLHYLIRQKGKKYAEEINAKDKFFKERDYEPMPELVKEYVHIIREASIEEIRKYDVILCTTAVGANPKVLEATNVYQVIIDEAGMCPEPQCLVPIIATKAEQVVLIGDHKQLRPIIMCKEAAQLGLETSLFERYATTKSSKNVEFTMLEEQYRMNPEICCFPSKMFYGSALKTMPGVWRDETLRIWPKDAKGIYPHVLVHVEGEERILTVSTEDGNEQSRSNDAEIEHVISTYRYMKREVPNESVQILSQYNAQCSEIKRRLKQEKFEEYDEVVSTVVSSQGGEWNYVIFSTVRSLPEYKIEKNPTLGWCKHNLGFITDRNQVNVALTRARKGLIIIGNKELLACDYVWKRLINHYDQRGCIKSPEEFPPKFIRKTRQQIMDEAYARTYRRFGESIFEKGEATSYEGSFDDEYNEDDIWKPRVAKRFTQR